MYQQFDMMQNLLTSNEMIFVLTPCHRCTEK